MMVLLWKSGDMERAGEERKKQRKKGEAINLKANFQERHSKL